MSAGQLWAFNLDDVAAKAKDLAGQKYEAPKSNLPAVFRDMKFADYQKIHFLQEKAEWAKDKTPFKLSFYHQGMHFETGRQAPGDLRPAGFATLHRCLQADPAPGQRYRGRRTVPGLPA